MTLRKHGVGGARVVSRFAIAMASLGPAIPACATDAGSAAGQGDASSSRVDAPPDVRLLAPLDVRFLAPGDALSAPRDGSVAVLDVNVQREGSPDVEVPGDGAGAPRDVTVERDGARDVGMQGDGSPEAPIDAPFAHDAPDARVSVDARADTGTPADASCVLTGGPEVIATGVAGAYLLRGTVLGPDAAFEGEVLVVGSSIACVAASCAGAGGGVAPTVIDAHGVIVPGLIDTHNHILFDTFDETDWTPTRLYTNHNQWTAEPRYEALVNAKQYLNGEDGSPWDYGCELDKYGELKGLVAATTSIVGAANPANRACFGSLARTIDQSPNGLPADLVQVATLFPTAASADGVCTNFSDAHTDAFLIHIAEGVDDTARAELVNLAALTMPAGCLFAPPTTIVHGTALLASDFAMMASAGMNLTWSPRSNVFLYGGGVDLTKTTDIPLALAQGVHVSIAPDWSIGGSQNVLDELRFAHAVDVANWGGILSSKTLFEMVTKNPARALGLSDTIGSLAVGLRADLAIISGDTTAPYDAVLAATPREVRLVLVDGVPLYGDAALVGVSPVPIGAAPCEVLDACCGAKFACVSRPSAESTDKLDETFAEIQSTLSGAVAEYDDMALSPYTFSPLTPVIRCDTAP